MLKRSLATALVAGVVTLVLGGPARADCYIEDCSLHPGSTAKFAGNNSEHAKNYAPGQREEIVPVPQEL